MKVLITLFVMYLTITAMSIILSIVEAIRQVAYKIYEDDFFDIFLTCCLYIFVSLAPGFNLYITILLILRILGFTDQSKKINW